MPEYSFGVESPAGGTPDVALHPSLLRRTIKSTTGKLPVVRIEN